MEQLRYPVGRFDPKVSVPHAGRAALIDSIAAAPQRLRAIASLGPHTAWVIKFDQAFSQFSGEQFVRFLTNFPDDDLHVKSITRDLALGHLQSFEAALDLIRYSL